ncbi:MAG: hypothetical protein A2W01_00955 [Candidatus Solincola sediminis]|uniref:Uncharacterized protein n=1 Tax=Candidatus Solincola sediminis TaxID=1797199 RepID=A0A1F2WR56_9ACTN|nr:MAG: hypothetical protein A2Y75_10935 [Candidatus Solincola sediminis]OFW61149.1 MAG: hypothetical protein A2W01_00955 [Candidatus Solincola sediminis]
MRRRDAIIALQTAGVASGRRDMLGAGRQREYQRGAAALEHSEALKGRAARPASVIIKEGRGRVDNCIAGSELNARVMALVRGSPKLFGKREWGRAARA